MESGSVRANYCLDMNDATKQSTNRNAAWQSWQVYVMAAICLVVGVLAGYLVGGSAPAKAIPQAQSKATTGDAPQPMPSLDDMKRMADKQVEPLLAKLQTDPKNADLLNQVANVYRMTHQFKTAASYYQKSLEANPKNVGARTDLASCLYYQGDADGAIAQLEQSLTYDPKHAGTLFNLGMIQWKGKGDASGAIASWQKLLKLNPGYENKGAVEKLIASARAPKVKALSQSE
jgi:cytochrome c-type biogenesis protein CcmH/NrfG